MTTPSREAMSSSENFRKFMEKARHGLTTEQIKQIINSDNAFRHSPHNPFKRAAYDPNLPTHQSSIKFGRLGRMLAFFRKSQ